MSNLNRFTVFHKPNDTYILLFFSSFGLLKFFIGIYFQSVEGNGKEKFSIYFPFYLNLSCLRIYSNGSEHTVFCVYGS